MSGNAAVTSEKDVYGQIVFRAIFHDEALYPNPHAFDPDRFLKDGKINPQVLDPAKFSFGFGRR